MIRYFLFIASLLIVSQSTKAQSLIGLEDVCVNGCQYYKVNNGLGGPYLWSIVGGDLDNNQGDSIQVCWDKLGVFQIDCFDLSAPNSNNKYSLEVRVSPEVEAELLFPLNAECGLRDTLIGGQGEFPPIECKSACELSIVKYFFNQQINANHSLEVIGGIIIDQNSDFVQVSWGLNGSGTIKLLSENSIGCADSIMYCIEILEKPVVTVTQPDGTNLPSSICLGQSLSLYAVSDLASEFEWQTSDGQFQVGVDAEFQFNNSGSYDIFLIGLSECECRDTTIINILVESEEGPVIDCIGPTCSGEEQSYYGPAGCSQYNWVVGSNGTVTGGGATGDNFVSVIWQSGPFGNVSLDVNGCGSTLCDEPTEVFIPVLDGNAYIQGEPVVCSDDISAFSAPYYGGAEYTWSIEGNGTILNGLSTNEINVQWDDSHGATDTAKISLLIENCFLGCEAYSEFIVNIKDQFILSGQTFTCDGNSSYFNTVDGYDGVDCDWEILDLENNVLLTESSTSWFNPSFSFGPGIFKIIARNLSGDYCNDQAEGFIEIISRPNTPIDIIGPDEICVNENYQYSVDLQNAQYEVEWIFSDGGNTIIEFGPSVYINWKSNGPYSVQVRIKDPTTNCLSEYYQENFLAIEEVLINGQDTTCVEGLEIYNFGQHESQNIDWFIIPADAGSVRDLKNGQLEIQWMLSGDHQLLADFCGQQFSFDVHVLNNQLTVNHPDELCFGELGLVDVITDPGNSVNIYTLDSTLVASTSSSNLPGGAYFVEVVTPQNCILRDQFTIHELPEPNIRISVNGETEIIGPITFFEITALASSQAYTYKWFKDGVSIGGNTDVLLTNQFGAYWLEIVDHNGCKGMSNIISVVSSGPPQPCDPIGEIRFVPNIGACCNEYDFTNVSTGAIANSIGYKFGDPESGLDNETTDENPSHTFTNAGYYPVLMLGLLQNASPPPEFCPSGYLEFIEVPLKADFDFRQSCAGSSTMFEERSTFLPSTGIASYAWDFGDPSSGVDNTSGAAAPNHIYVNPGSYLVNLEVRSTEGCVAKINKIIEVFEKPDSDFTLPNVQCADTGIKFIAPQQDGIIDYSWDFGDPTTGHLNSVGSAQAIHEFAASGNYNVSLTVTNIRGCTSTTTKVITISNNGLSGDITADKVFPVCYGEEVTLTAPNGGLVYLWSNGESGQSIVVEEAGIYSVTVTSAQACDYVPDDILVEQLPAKLFPIRGYIPDPSTFIYDYQFDSLVICYGEDFVINTNYDFNVDFTWSNGFTGYSFSNYQTGNLSSGTHVIELEAVDKSTGCVYPTDPFLIIVKDNPLAPVIVHDQLDVCADKLFTISVSNPEGGMRYYWNTGQEGLELVTAKPGLYYVTAINENGCSTESNLIGLIALPDANILTSGCEERCFPDTLCIGSINPLETIQWLLDGEEIAGPEGQSEMFIAQGSGAYQIILTNIFGCTDTSGILNLDPIPSDHSLDGFVYIDKNSDGVFTAMDDEPLENATIRLWDNTNMIMDTNTDANGYFEFQFISYNELMLEIDTTGLNLNLNMPLLEYMVEFTKCNDGIYLNLPLEELCTPTSESIVYEVCESETITHDGMSLAAGDSLDLMYTNEEGCDSLVNVSVELRDVPQPMFSLTNPCYLQADGIIEINNSSMSAGATYSIDGVNFQIEPLFDQVSAGVYTIYLNDETCLHEYEVELLDGVELVADQMIPTIECGQTEALLNIELAQAQGAVDYDWSTGEASESITVNEPGYYSLSIYDDCSTLFFEWNIDLETPGLEDIDEFPNIFSPNRDGQNDCLIMSPEFVDRAISYEFHVFDRWGNHVFESFDPSFCWEGLHQGVEAETGVYVWILNYSLMVCDEERFFSKKGDICVVR